MSAKLYFLTLIIFLSCNKLSFNRVKYKDVNIEKLIFLIRNKKECTEEDVLRKVKILIPKIDVNINSFLGDKENYTLAMIAAAYGRSNILKELIKAGANLGAKTKKGSTALQFAKDAKKQECVNIINDYLY